MTSLTVEKNKLQQGRGVFSTIFLNGTPLAEKHNGQITTMAVQPEAFDLMVSLNIPIDESVQRFSWKAAQRIFAEA